MTVHKSTLTLKQFMLRTEVLTLYKNILRTIKKIPDDYYRQDMKDWARRDFRKFKHLEDENYTLPENSAPGSDSNSINPLPDSKILDWSSLKGVAYNKLKEAIKMMITKGKLSLRELEQIIGHAK